MGREGGRFIPRDGQRDSSSWMPTSKSARSTAIATAICGLAQWRRIVSLQTPSRSHVHHRRWAPQQCDHGGAGHARRRAYGPARIAAGSRDMTVRVFRPTTRTTVWPNSCVWALAEDSKRALWIGTWGGGAFRYHDGQFTQYSTSRGMAGDIVASIVASRDGTMWFGTRGERRQPLEEWSVSHLYDRRTDLQAIGSTGCWRIERV